MDCGTGGNMATVFQIVDPVKPTTVSTPSCGRGPGGHLHGLGGPPPHALRLAVAPDPGGQDALVPLVDRVVADGLPGEVVGDRVHLQAVLLEDVPAALHVAGVLDGRPRVEVVAPAGDLQPVVAPLAGQPGHLLERQVGPLAGEQGDRSYVPSFVGRECCAVYDTAQHSRLAIACQPLPAAADRATASSTSCTCRPSANDGVGSRSAARSLTRSTISWVNECS